MVQLKVSFKLFLFTVVFILGGSLSAQEVTVVSDWKDFGPIPKTWKQVGSVQADWEQSDFLSTGRGNGILVNPPKPKNGPHLVSGFEHGDIALELEYMVPKGSNSGVYLQGRYEIQIFDSWGKINPSSADAGGIYQRFDTEKRRGFEGKAPRMNVSRAPGLWQHLKIVFEAPEFNDEGEKVKNAKFVQVFLNGVLIHENVEVSGPTTSAMFEDEQELGPIMIQGDHGPVAVRNLSYQLFGKPVPEIKELRYDYYKGKFQSVDEFQGKEPDETSKLSKITWDLGHGIVDFAYEYSGNFEILTPGNYTFTINSFGRTSLYVNGENILEDDSESNRSQSITLEAGSVPFKLVFYKPHYPRRRPQLGFLVEGPGIKMTPLHDPNSYLDHMLQKPLFVEAINEPAILRGFYEHGEQKRTHTVGVGEPCGINYVYDLQLGAPLGMWRGEFMDASPMWRQRGVTQLMIPNGALTDLAGGSTIAKLDNQQSAWPDSLSADLLQIQGYVLNATRRPTFNYVYDQVEVEDYFEPEMEGKILSRTLTYHNPEQSTDFWARIIAADTIEEMGEGLYLVNQGQFYIKLPDSKMTNAVIRDMPSGQELIIPLSTSIEKSTINYSYIY